MRLLVGPLLVAALAAVAAARPAGAAAQLPGGISVGAPRVLENLTLFALRDESPEHIGPLLTFDEALSAGKAEVREMGAKGGAGPRVDTLEVENRGDVPIYVLAGSVVKGGNQDRQISQDFIIEPHKTVAVDAFCVEHGRWSSQRGQGHERQVWQHGAARTALGARRGAT